MIAKKNLVKVPVSKTTVPHEATGKHGGGFVLLKPASPGTGVIAGGAMRAVLESAGIKDVLAKSKGSSNPHILAEPSQEPTSPSANEMNPMVRSLALSSTLQSVRTVRSKQKLHGPVEPLQVFPSPLISR